MKLEDDDEEEEGEGERAELVETNDGEKIGRESQDEQIEEEIQRAEEMYAKAIVNNDENKGNENGEEKQEEYDNFDENIHTLNKQYRPYRDQNNNNEDEEDENCSSDENFSITSATSTIMDPRLVRARVKRSLLKRQKAEKRRIRNKGESALITQRMRDINDTIKSSLVFD